MTNPTGDIRDRMHTQADVLASLMQVDLPLVSWVLNAYYTRLEGQIYIHYAETDQAKRAAIEAWAKHLGTEMTEKPCRVEEERKTWTELEAAGMYGGVLVRVWAHVDFRVVEEVSA